MTKGLLRFLVVHRQPFYGGAGSRGLQRRTLFGTDMETREQTISLRSLVL